MTKESGGKGRSWSWQGGRGERGLARGGGVWKTEGMARRMELREGREAQVRKVGAMEPARVLSKGVKMSIDREDGKKGGSEDKQMA